MSGSNVIKLNTQYPRAQDWWSPKYSPVIVPRTSRPVLFYYHLQWKAATSEEDRLFWELLFELEDAVLYAASWWYKASRFGIAVILPTLTVRWLEERIGNIKIDPEESSDDAPNGKGPVKLKHFADRMFEARHIDISLRNRVFRVSDGQRLSRWFLRVLRKLYWNRGANKLRWSSSYQELCK